MPTKQPMPPVPPLQRSREYGGAGLGLSLVWEIANLHGGSVRVEESSDRGTTIAVELPVQ